MYYYCYCNTLLPRKLHQVGCVVLFLALYYITHTHTHTTIHNFLKNGMLCNCTLYFLLLYQCYVGDTQRGRWAKFWKWKQIRSYEDLGSIMLIHLHSSTLLVPVLSVMLEMHCEVSCIRMCALN